MGISAATAGVTCTLIDFTLSRLAATRDAVAYCDLAADPELFAGPRGNPQAEAYRRMKKLTRGDWQAYQPATNAAWLHYLADACLTHKLPQVCACVRVCVRARAGGFACSASVLSLQRAVCTRVEDGGCVHGALSECLAQRVRIPAPHPLLQCPHGGDDKLALRGFRKRALGYTSAGDALGDEYFAGCWTAV